MIAQEVIDAHAAGASIAHLHVWDHDGQPTGDLGAFHRTIARIREGCDIIIEGSTGGVGDLTAAERCVSLHADIEMASLNVGSVNYDQGVYVNSPDDVRFWASEMARRHIKPDIAVFEVGMIQNALRLADEGLLKPPYLFSFVLGQTGALPATPKNLLFLAESVPDGAVWGAAGHGGADLPMSSLAMMIGGHARAGFEDNPYYAPKRAATSNAELVRRLVRIAGELGRPVATPAQARGMLGLADRQANSRG